MVIQTTKITLSVANANDILKVLKDLGHFSDKDFSFAKSQELINKMCVVDISPIQIIQYRNGRKNKKTMG